MNVELIFKIAGVGILVSVLYTVLKQAGKEEQGQLVALAGVVIVLMMVIQLVVRLFETVRTMFRL
ncbi:MAG: stage III sporulation protein AC [Firmicutes bacterium]|nr:stage III sporulation protein AC [Bacillota bacterium]MDI6823187.1 stage III sporulation protein AC [Bacillota bacterium]MDI7248497.1 stage III sporulation protein AC [Bacillota bacterium]